MQKPIQDFSVGYTMLKHYSRFFVRKFFKTTTIVGLDNIPKDRPVIITPNHQDTLMDALCIIYNVHGRAVFMARADIFGKSKLIANTLRFLKILPLYRIRDGVKELKNNDASFEEAVGVLESRQKLVVLPEGSHVGERRLRQLKKGVARIAFMAEERNNFELGLEIVPAGLDYTHYINVGARFMVQYGKPIQVAKYKDLYHENPQKAMAALMDEIRAGMLPLMLNLDNEAEYKTLETLDDIYINDLYQGRQSRRSVKHTEILAKKQQMGEKLMAFAQSQSAEYENVKQLADEFRTLLKKLNLRLWAVARDKYSAVGIFLSRLLQLALLPVFVAGFVPNILPFALPMRFSRGIKDPQFLSSVRFVISVVLFFLFYLIYLIPLLILLPKWWMAIVTLVALPYLAALAFRYYVWFRKTTARARINRMRRQKNADWLRLTECRDAILNVLRKM